MDDFPRELDGARVLKYARLTEDVRPTGQTRHYLGDVECEPFAALAIAHYPGGGPGGGDYYLFYLSDDDVVVQDTDHHSAREALDQAAREYEGTISWNDVVPE